MRPARCASAPGPLDATVTRLQPAFVICAGRPGLALCCEALPSDGDIVKRILDALGG